MVAEGAGAVSYEAISADEHGALIRCPDCGLEAKIQAPPGVDRAEIMRTLREVRGCECPVGKGGTAAVSPGMFVYRLSDGRKLQVQDIQPRNQQIRCLDERDGLTNWMDVHKVSKKPPGLQISRTLQKIKAGLL